ncbi:tetratricopeptide repeat protein, partial [bacterium]|nr:tetratricopeptide repeat protein [candidate division CSSED10-310 bacterium]
MSARIPAALRTRWSVAVIVSSLAVLSHLPALENRFSRDDIPIVTENDLVTGTTTLSDVFAAFHHPYWPEIQLGLYRPLTIATHGVICLAFGLEPFWYHLASLLGHAAAACLFTLWVIHLSGDRFAGLVGGALWAVHPVHGEVVDTVVGRADSMATACALAALLLLRPAIRFGRLAAGALLLLAAMLCKESAVVVIAWLALDFLVQHRAGKMNPARAAVALAVAATAPIVYFMMKKCQLGYMGLAHHSTILPLDNPLVLAPLPHRLLGVANVWGTALIRIVWPFTQCADYSHPQLPAARLTLAGWVGFAIPAAITVYMIRRHRVHLSCPMGVLLFASAFLPVSNLVFPIGTIFADRLLYLPSMGIILALGWRLAALHGRIRLKAVLLMLLIVAVVLLSCRSWRRAPIWRDNASLFAAAVREAPRSAKAWYNWGTLMAISRPDQMAVGSTPTGEAAAAYRQALELYPEYKDALYNLAALYLDQGQPLDGVGLLERAIEVGTVDPEVFNLLGVANHRLGRTDAARRAFSRTLELAPDHAGAALNLGMLELEAGRPAAAA